jgi:hypothetical protein
VTLAGALVWPLLTQRLAALRGGGEALQRAGGGFSASGGFGGAREALFVSGERHAYGTLT